VDQNNVIYIEKGYRCCNWFGISEKKPNKILELIAEINFSLCHGKTSGKLVSDGNNIFVTHNGGIGKSKIQKDIFWDNFKGKYFPFKEEKIVLIGELTKMDHKEIYDNIKNFVEQVIKIKNIAKEDEDDNKQQNIKSYNSLSNTSAILIKNNNNNKKKQKLTSNIKHEILNGAIDLLIPVLPGFIENTLQKNDKNNWWQKFVINKLPPNTVRGLPKTGTYSEYIKELDLSLCIKIIIENWKNIFKYIIKDIKFSWVHELIEIRNDVSHWSAKKSTSYTFETISHTLNTITLFMRSIDVNVAGQIFELKKEFEDKYENE